MAIRKFRLFLASGLEKEEQWLTAMSAKGLHMKKYKLGFYTFEEDKNKAFVYQIDFQRIATDDYIQLYEDAGWNYVDQSIGLFHYFRTDASNESVPKIYSDYESVVESYKGMLRFYMILFAILLLSQLGGLLTWKWGGLQIFTMSLTGAVVVLYIYMLIALKRKINFYKRN
ncbi:hypothetical protein OBCHQ24_01575 [Oceanobacillus iheyensis]|uniref:DUF2812 domain-containing protein n=1 Tax=Oceanobacillus jordanicus TaxID=2867266 RepID=A0AAW5B7F9_9BACI|nr:DUF2812 domain-containing protein [Oceanobacillus jordanicus]AVQ97797.1 hypothetical protein OBCHQ24_01575 [Oceanobacillus iheyensis]MCG3419164.1 DUF2812 domain-containing protein [Oceanobacillus jordanicus]NAO99158.1 DUF2812 domain-containing protein [Halomonas sp. MG34]